MEKVEGSTKAVVSAMKKKSVLSSRTVLTVGLIVLLLIAGGIGYAIGRDRTISAYEKELSITAGQNDGQPIADVPNPVTLLGIEIVYTNDPATNQRRLAGALDKVTQQKLDQANFEELLQIHSMAQNTGKTALKEMTVKEIVSRKSTFSADQQKAIEELKIGQ